MSQRNTNFDNNFCYDINNFFMIDENHSNKENNSLKFIENSLNFSNLENKDNKNNSNTSF